MESSTRECDICGKRLGLNEYSYDIQTIHETSNEDGKKCNPFLEFHSLDLCKVCHDSVLTGRSVFCSGAMGYFKFYFKEPNYDKQCVEDARREGRMEGLREMDDAHALTHTAFADGHPLLKLRQEYQK
jgi:hypothetical protein